MHYIHDSSYKQISNKVHSELETDSFKGFLFSCEEHKLNHQNSGLGSLSVPERATSGLVVLIFTLCYQNIFSLTNIHCLLSAKEFDSPNIGFYNELPF